MVDLEACFSESGLEVEWRAKGNLYTAIANALGEKPIKLPVTDRKDTYFYFHQETGGDCRRLRLVQGYDSQGRPTKPRHYESIKIYVNNNGDDGNHAFELQRPIDQEEYDSRRSIMQPVVEVVGRRSDLWVVNEKLVYEKPPKVGELHICIDDIHELGKFTEFEVEVVGSNSMKKKQRTLERKAAEKIIFDFTERLGLGEPDLIMKTYPEMLLEKQQPRMLSTY